MENNDLLLYIRESEKARSVISENVGSEISNLEFQVALGKQLGYDEGNCSLIVNHQLPAAEMIKLLIGYDFDIPIESISVTFESSILPEDVPSRLDEKKVKVHGEVWKVNKYDKDHCPSNPHAHNMATGYKLHLGSGDLFDSKCHYLNSRISRRDLVAIRERLNGWTLPALAV